MADSIGVALVGFGYWGRNLARNIVESETTHLVGVVEPSDDSRAGAGRTYPGSALWTALDQALADDRVQAVVLSTPAATHGDLAIRTLEAGRHVLVEKPLATTVEDALRVESEAARRSLVAMVGHTFLYAAPVTWLRERIREGAFGDLKYLYSQRLSLGRIRQDCDALWNLAPHDLSILMYLLDEPIVEVSARAFDFLQPGIPDVYFASLVFGSGIAANLHVSWIDPRKTRLLTVVGNEKMAVYNDVSADQKIWVFDSGAAPEPSLGEYESFAEFQWKTRAGDIVIPRLKLTEPLLNELTMFGHACLTGATVPSDARHGVDVVRALAAITESAERGGAAVEIDR